MRPFPDEVHLRQFSCHVCLVIIYFLLLCVTIDALTILNRGECLWHVELYTFLLSLNSLWHAEFERASEAYFALHSGRSH
jgi:hypothetical protein